MNRYRAFFLHLTVSCLLALGIGSLVFFVWYPWPLSQACGTFALFFIVLGVDVVLGPLLTLAVFNPLKKELKFDLAIIVVMQFVALVYGISTLSTGRPVFVVFNADRFDLVYASDMTAEKQAKAQQPEFRTTPLFGPEIIGTRRPADPKERLRILMSALSGGDDLPQMPEYFVPYSHVRDEVKPRIQSLDELARFNPKDLNEVNNLIDRYRAIDTGVGFLPLKGRIGDLSVVVRRDNAEVLEIVDLKPWS
jgi:hypothetical protein